MMIIVFLVIFSFVLMFFMLKEKFTDVLGAQSSIDCLKFPSSPLMKSCRFSIPSSETPIFVGILLLNESVSHLQILGVIIILVSALLIQLQREL